jgi:hypothetical protein
MSKKTALAAIIVGVLANNYIYLHDIVMQKHDGLIDLGTKSTIGIAIAVIVILVGVIGLTKASSASAG